MSEVAIVDDRARLIIGLDFGTTWSGYVYPVIPPSKPVLTSTVESPLGWRIALVILKLSRHGQGATTVSSVGFGGIGYA